MKIIFLHRNFPAQFRHLAVALAADPKNQVVFLTNSKDGQIAGVDKYLYKVTRDVSPKTHRYVRQLESAVCDGQAAWRTARQLKQGGFEPDVIYAHIGWGPGLFLRDLFPDTPYLGFFEWYYHAYGTDANYDPNDPIDEDSAARIRIKNASILLELAHCHGGVVPTHWQHQQFPTEFKQKLRVLHDGIDTQFFQPQPDTPLVFGSMTAEQIDRALGIQDKTSKLTPTQKIQREFWLKGLDLSNKLEIVTYVSRGMEPYRGFPQFMNAVSLLQKERSQCQVVVVGEDRVAYGKRLADGRTYREKALADLELDHSRLHFTGRLSYEQLRMVYQASSVHIYLTYPFVLSWSMLEAMACGCVIVGSRTPPLEEVITDGENGFLVDFFDSAALANQVSDVLEHQDDPQILAIRKQARETILERYDLSKLLPQHLDWLKSWSEQS
ncbi:MAG: glycosyltransferase family 4 protein [Cyanobacteria bacterium P01_H01_bin.15]